jgi:dTMP kinase
VSGAGDSWSPVSETLMFYAARVEHVTRKILPALESGTHVLCDRFSDSTLVYQGVGKNLPEDFILSLHRLALGNFLPQLTLILDIDPEIGLKRACAMSHDEKRFESLPLDFHRRIRSGFLNLAAKEPSRCVVLDANQNLSALHQEVINIIHKNLGMHL